MLSARPRASRAAAARASGRGALHVAASVAVAPAPASTTMETLRFLSAADARAVRSLVGTPAYVYDAATLKAQAAAALAFPHAFGLTVNYAMKSSPNAAILRARSARARAGR